VSLVPFFLSYCVFCLLRVLVRTNDGNLFRRMWTHSFDVSCLSCLLLCSSVCTEEGWMDAWKELEGL